LRSCDLIVTGSTGLGVIQETPFSMEISFGRAFREVLWMPAKFKMAVNGCPHYAESGTKDVGIVGNNGGWEVFVGGNCGIKLRAADSQCKVNVRYGSNSIVTLISIVGR
jgi:nitrite reductase (NADH) large subunit